MDSFESVIAKLMEKNGFWVRTLLKVKLTKEDKAAIGRKTVPRWEIDVVGYRAGDNVLRIIECKSFLDSPGVRMAGFDPTQRASKRYKLFNESNTRKVVFNRLVSQLVNSKAILPDPKIEFCLAAGNIVESSKEPLRAHFEANSWRLFGPEWIRKELSKLAKGKYEDEVVSVMAKLLLRD